MFKDRKGILITLAIIIVLLAIASRFVNFSEIANVLVKADVSLLLLALVCEVIALCLKTFRWKTLVSEIKQISFFELFKIEVAGTAISNLTPARVGETAKALYLERHGVKKRFSLLTIFWERLFDLIAILIFSTFIASTFSGAIPIIFALICIAIIGAYHADKIALRLSRIRRLSFLGDLTLHKFSKKTLLTSMLVTLVAWLFDLLAVSLAFQAVGAALPFTQIMGAFSISIIVGIISAIPGGFGSAEAVLFLLLKDSYPSPVLGAAFVATRLVTLIWIFLIGGICAILLEQKQSK